MMYALVDGERTRAQPHLVGRCDLCDGEVIPKCGWVNVWHWAHRTLEGCDEWAEPITEWHVDWQEQFPPEAREVALGAHRADIYTPSGLVIEFQHSGLSVDEIWEREEHYGEMIWVFDEEGAYQDNRLNLRRKDRRRVWYGEGPYDWHWDDDYNDDWLAGDRYRTFRWKHPRRSIQFCRKPVVLDLGDGLMFALKKMHPKAPYGGWGYVRTRDEFLARFGMAAAS